jgi:hypothetical protein
MKPEERDAIRAEVAAWPAPSPELLKRIAVMVADEINEMARED